MHLSDLPSAQGGLHGCPTVGRGTHSFRKQYSLARQPEKIVHHPYASSISNKQERITNGVFILPWKADRCNRKEEKTLWTVIQLMAHPYSPRYGLSSFSFICSLLLKDLSLFAFFFFFFFFYFIFFICYCPKNSPYIIHSAD